MKAMTERRGYNLPAISDRVLVPATERIARSKQMHEAIGHLKNLIKEGQTVYTTLQHVSRSGTMKVIRPWIVGMRQDYGMEEFEPIDITGLTASACGLRYNKKHHGIEINGEQRDAGGDVVESLSFALHGEPQSRPDAGRTLKHKRF